MAPKRKVQYRDPALAWMLRNSQIQEGRMMVGYQMEGHPDPTLPHPVIPVAHSPTYVPPRSRAAAKAGAQTLMIITSKARPGEPDTVKALLPVPAAVPKKRPFDNDSSWWTPDSEDDVELASASSS